MTAYNVKIGDYVEIGNESVVEAVSIGSFVRIGKRCVIVSLVLPISSNDSKGEFCVIKDCAVVLDGSVIAPLTVVPSFSVYGGSPGEHALSLLVSFAARYIEDTPDCIQDMIKDEREQFYHQQQ